MSLFYKRDVDDLLWFSKACKEEWGGSKYEGAALGKGIQETLQ